MKNEIESNIEGFDVHLMRYTPISVYKTYVKRDIFQMADLVGVYSIIWKPNDYGINKASKLIPHLERAIEELEKNPDFFKALQPEEKWSTYENFLAWLKRYLSACRNYPDAEIHIDRSFAYL
jgi:hypothetical protein